MDSSEAVAHPRHVPRHLRRCEAHDQTVPTRQLPPPPDRTDDDVVDRFLAGTLDRASWTHDAHLAVARRIVAEAPDLDAALGRMRPLIQAHNRRVGLRDGSDGYHETVTRYFLLAVAHAAPATQATLAADPACDRSAPQRHWSAACLASDRARRAWVEPDLSPLPWPSGR